MALNLWRFCSLPNLLKPIHVLVAISVMISVGTADIKPSGTGFIWFTTIFTLIVSLAIIALFALKIEDLVVPRFCPWPLFEVLYSIIVSIFFFVSVWLCVNGAEYNQDNSGFVVAGFFCFANFIILGFNAVLFIRIFLADRRVEAAAANIESSGTPNYGGP